MSRIFNKPPKKFKDPVLQKREREQRKAAREQRKAARQALTPIERRQKQKSAQETRRAKKAAATPKPTKPSTGPTPMPSTPLLFPSFGGGKSYATFSKGGVPTKKAKGSNDYRKSGYFFSTVDNRKKK